MRKTHGMRVVARASLVIAAVLVSGAAGCQKPADIPQNANRSATSPVNAGAANRPQETNAVLPMMTNAGTTPVPATLSLPVDRYAERRTVKTHGKWIQDRFRGFHLGDDVEFTDTAAEVPVHAIADGTVQQAGRVSGYGGLVVIDHAIGGERLRALYGHLDLGSVSLSAGDTVTPGQVIGNLGEGGTDETDGERKHLHFALNRDTGAVRVQGYEQTPAALATWLNPSDVFADNGVALASPARRFDHSVEQGGEHFPLAFTIPAGMEVEYVPAINALNLFSLAGEGTARERSQIFIRFFDASDFLTLSTVTIHATEDLSVGAGDYRARRYDIEKKPDAADFPDQPSWRNARHTVTDFRDRDGQTRYYVVAQRPGLSDEIYMALLESTEVVP